MLLISMLLVSHQAPTWRILKVSAAVAAAVTAAAAAVTAAAAAVTAAAAAAAVLTA